MSRMARVVLPLIVIIAALIGAARSVVASSVVEMTLPEMADHAGQAIVGVVRSVESYWANDPRRIESRVLFEQVEYLKGALPDAADTFELVVPGGTIGDTRMQVCCAPQFGVGQKWVLLLLPEYRTFPIVGLYQGAFEIIEDQAGVERVAHTLHGVRHPIVDLDKNGFTHAPNQRIAPVADRIKHVSNLRVVADPMQASLPAAMTLDEFTSKLQPILAASRHHALAAPAGRRVVPQERPGVALKSAEFDASPDRSGEIVRPGHAQVLDSSASKRGSE